MFFLHPKGGWEPGDFWTNHQLVINFTPHLQPSTSTSQHPFGASKIQSPSISVQRNSRLPQLVCLKVGFCTIFFKATGLLFVVVPNWWNLTYPVKSHFGDSKLTPWKRTYPVKIDGWFRLKWFVRGSLIFGVIFSFLISPQILCWCFNFWLDIYLIIHL